MDNFPSTMQQHEVCKLIGVPYFVLNKWIERGHLKLQRPTIGGRGIHRIYTANDARRIKLMWGIYQAVQALRVRLKQIGSEA